MKLLDNVLWSIGHELLIEDVEYAKGCCIYTKSKKEYLDFESGTWCLPLGHCNDRVTRALKRQSEVMYHTGYCYSQDIVNDAASSVLAITGCIGGRCAFLSSGSEAVEFGVQLMRKVTEKKYLLTLKDSFLSSYGSSGKRDESEWCFADWGKCNSCSEEKCSTACSVLAEIPWLEVGGFVFEPGSSSGLVRFPPDKLIKEISRKVRAHEGFIQVNEITTGIGRTGKWFGFMHYSMQPDIVSMGKGIGNGYPVSVIALNTNIMQVIEQKGFYYSQSHQNDPLGCAVVKEVINVLQEENLIEKAAAMGSYLLKCLQETMAKCAAIKEVRGRGLMTVIEFAEEVEESVVADVFQRLLEKGIIVAKRPKLKAIRIDPPLIIGKGGIDYFIKSLAEVLHTV